MNSRCGLSRAGSSSLVPELVDSGSGDSVTEGERAGVPPLPRWLFGIPNLGSVLRVSIGWGREEMMVCGMLRVVRPWRGSEALISTTGVGGSVPYGFCVTPAGRAEEG